MPFANSKFALIPAAVILTAATFSIVVRAEEVGLYKTPPAPLQAIIDQLRAPTTNLSPHRDLIAMVKTPTLPGIREVAQPELKLAGLRINPRTYSQSRFSFGEDLWLLDIDTRKEIRLSGLPQNLKLADMAWSPDQRSLAFTHIAETGGVELWLVDIPSHAAKKNIGRAIECGLWPRL